MSENIYEAPAAELENETNTVDALPLARRRARFVSAMIDGLIASVPSWILIFILGYDKFFDESLVNPYAVASGFLTAIVYMAINYRGLTSSGQTIGKRIMNNKVVDLEGNVPSSKQIFKRYGFYLGTGLIPVIGGLFVLINELFILGREKRCLHDQVAATRVVRL